MVVLAVIAILAVTATAAFRRNEFANQRARFVADVEGMLVQARNAAVDQQSRVRVTVDATSVSLTLFDTSDDTWRAMDRAALEVPNASLIGDNATVCVYGFTPGVQAPSQATAVTEPSDCVAEAQTIVFEPDGRFSDPDGLFTAVPNAGATLWIADRSLSNDPRFTLLQIFPGGLVRTFEQLQ
jgi:Tfp pilus assembly protein FimT